MPGAAHETAATLEAAADLLALAMSESHGPIDTLGRAFERMARALAECSRAIERHRELESPRNGEPAAPRLAQLEACQAVLEREISLCIESLQFHDRLMQRLSRVGECLAGLTAPAPADAGRELRRVNLSEGSIELF
jgi:hypothetical protein